MNKYICIICGYVYDPTIGDVDDGVDPGTSFDSLPDNWVCPCCGIGTSDFKLDD